MLSVEWAICYDEQVAYRPLVIWRLIRKNLYSLNFLKNSGKRSARSWKTGAPAAGGYHIEYGYLCRVRWIFPRRSDPDISRRLTSFLLDAASLPAPICTAFSS